MFNNNSNNSNNSQNIWVHKALFNQLTLHNILNSKNNLGTPELRAAIASMTEKYNVALAFIDCSTEY